MKTIDITPSSVDLVDVIILILTRGDYEGKKTARNELLRIARLADAQIKYLKENES